MTSFGIPAAVLRPRRLIALTLVVVGLLFFLGTLELPENLKDTGYAVLSRTNIAQLIKSKKKGANVDEIFGVLHLLVQEPDGGAKYSLSQLEDLDPSKPLALDLYSGGGNLDWEESAKTLDKTYPLVVLSKTYCPYSRGAKQLLASYNLRPAPKFVELDMRDDSHIIKEIMTRLTGFGTVPNILVHGKSLGGMSDIKELHEKRELRKAFEKAGIVVRNGQN